MTNENERLIREELSKAGATRHIIHARAMTFLRVSHAVGMFSTFEAELQGYFSLQSSNAFDVTKDTLEKANHKDLSINLSLYKDAINVLKHGHGRSYERLLKYDNLPFAILKPGEYFFFEGDIGEINILIEVNDKFLLDCVNLINDISTAVRHDKY